MIIQYLVEITVFTVGADRSEDRVIQGPYLSENGAKRAALRLQLELRQALRGTGRHIRVEVVPLFSDATTTQMVQVLKNQRTVVTAALPLDDVGVDDP